MGRTCKVEVEAEAEVGTKGNEPGRTEDTNQEAVRPRGLKVGTIHPAEVTLRFLHGWPEAEVHRAKDDQTSSELKRIEYSFDHGGDGIESTVHLPEAFLEFFRGHPFRSKDDRGHIVF